MMQVPRLGQSGPVAMRPRGREALEVGGVVAAAVGVAPETDRHRRQGSGEHQLTFLSDHGAARVVEHLDGRAQAPTGDLARPHRVQGAAGHESRAHVCPPAHRGQQHIGGYGLVDPAGTAGGQRRAGGAQGAQLRQVVARRRAADRPSCR